MMLFEKKRDALDNLYWVREDTGTDYFTGSGYEIPYHCKQHCTDYAYHSCFLFRNFTTRFEVVHNVILLKRKGRSFT